MRDQGQLGVLRGNRCQCRHDHDARRATNRDWAEDNDFRFPILSDYWPHGEVSRAYDTFDETFGYAKRTTYILDSDGVIRDVIASDVLGEARPFATYLPALESVT